MMLVLALTEAFEVREQQHRLVPFEGHSSRERAYCTPILDLTSACLSRTERRDRGLLQ